MLVGAHPKMIEEDGCEPHRIADAGVFIIHILIAVWLICGMAVILICAMWLGAEVARAIGTLIFNHIHLVI